MVMRQDYELGMRYETEITIMITCISEFFDYVWMISLSSNSRMFK